MARRSVVILGVFILLAGVIGAGFWLLSHDPGNLQAGSRLRVGMTEPEVQAILGRPADRAYHPWDIVVLMPPAPGTSPEWERVWVGQGWMILVHFDEAGKVTKVGGGEWAFDSPPPKTVSRRFWRWLGW